MSKHEFTGKTTEEAISEGLRKLGCTISDVKVEVLEEGAKGLFGLFGSKHVRVLLTLDDSSDDMLSALSSLTLDSFDDRERPKQEHHEHSERTERPATAEKRPPKKRPSEQQDPAQPKPGAEPKMTPPAMEGPPVAHDPGTAMGRAQQFVQELTRLMNVAVRVDVQADPEGNLLVQMAGDTLGILIGRRGETLDALQYLTSLQVNKGSEEYIRVTLDTENYRAKREDSLRRLAARMAARAYKTGRKVPIEPMNPYERRILHASLQSHPHVTTHSEGEEPNRHVVITLKDGVRPPARRPVQ